MSLELLIQGIGVKENSWVNLQKDTKTLRGLPWGPDSMRTLQYTLKATDTANNIAEYDVEIRVQESSLNPTNLFTVTIDEVFSKFANDLPSQIRLYDTLYRIYNENSDSSIHIQGVTEGSTVISYSVINVRSQPQGKVDCDTVQAYIDTAFNGDHIKATFAYSFLPFKLKEVSFVPDGACEGQLEPKKGVVRYPVPITDPELEPIQLYIIIVPIVIVVVIAVIVIIVVVVMRRRRRADREVTKANGTYIEKGVPVVFEEDMATIDRKGPAVTDPLLGPTTPHPPAYPQNGNPETIPLKPRGADSTEQRYPTPPLSEHDETDR